MALDVFYEGDPDAWVVADAVRLGQILNNLISNALKFTAQGRVEVRILLQSAEEDADLSISVSDNGPGVPSSARERIFVPFQQAEQGARMGGAGLGLAVCRQLALRMGGAIGVKDNSSGGAVFMFRAGLRLATQPVSATHEEHEVGRSAHVLIVDDNPTNLLVARNLCEIFGCTSESVDNGLSAVEAAASDRFDVILMDIQMPIMDGMQATRAIRTLRSKASRVPILALTANADPAADAYYRRSGINGVVAKPISAEALLKALNAVLVAGGPSHETLVA